MDKDAITTMKEYASEKTGVPVHLINGETSEEIAASAAALAAFKRQHTEAQNTEPLTAREQFAAWLNDVSGNDILTAEPPAEPTPTAADSYPVIKDGGTPPGADYGPIDPRESFREWFGEATAFNPFKNNDLWR